MALSFAAARPARQAMLCLLLLAGAAQARPGTPAIPVRKLEAAYLYRVAAFADEAGHAVAARLLALAKR